MSTPSAIPAPPGTPQVLLFGHTGSGKSALLGALLKAAETQGPTLRGEVLEASGRMASIRDAVYRGDDLKGNDTELTSYTVRLRPWRDGTRAVTDPVTVVLHDCSGAAAEGLIQDPDRLRNGARDAPVARAVVESDAIVLLVNGGADDEELLAAFEEFDTFLTRVAAGKVAAREVGGMPVLLALTQCDRLARPGDTFAEWEGRVLQRGDRAWAKFDAFLKDAEGEEDGPSPFLPFGSIDLTVHPVAVRTPKLPGATAPPATPYGVAELFRDAFASAKARRERVTASDRRLKWTVRLAGAFVALLLLGVIAVAVFQPTPGGANLAERVRGYELTEPPAAVRLAYPYLTRNKATLTGFRDDRGFTALPDDLKEFVVGRLKEVDEYEAYRAKQAVATAPADTRTLEDLAKVEQALGADLALPRPAWGETAAAQLREKWRADAAAIRRKEDEFLDRYRDLARRGVVLTLRPSLAENWRAEVAALEAAGGLPPGLADPLRDSPALPQPRGEAVTARVPFEFERVYHARQEWDAVRDRLLHLRDLGDALGLTAGPEELRVLALPEPGPGVNSAALPGARLTALLRGFPRETADFREWEVRNFPDPARSLVADRLDRSFRTGARHVQELLRARVGADTLEDWRKLADVLGDPATPFPEWGKLLHLIARLRDPAAPNPVGELTAFLRRESFDIDPTEFTVLIPPDLGLDKVTPAGPLAVTVGAATRTFKPAGDGVREGPATRYRFAADGGKLTYRPGDELRAELPVRVGAQEAKLVWDTPGPRAYQFDKLAREPRLVKPGGASEPAAGVRLTPTPDAALPRLPVLFPDVRK
jgi:uncharacterized protein (DUF2267 family)/energy-coupling factor transporter ATP-binding protein EcfA2